MKCSARETATKVSLFAHFGQGTQSLAPDAHIDMSTSKIALYPSVFSTFDFEICFASHQRALFGHVNFQRCSEHAWCLLYILAWKFASRHIGGHFFAISTSKIGRSMELLCSVLELEMWFVPHLHSSFRHRNFQKWSENGVACTS